MLDTTAFTSVAPSASLFVSAASAAAPMSARPVAASLKPSLFAELPYHSSLLLSASLDVSLTAHADFSQSCEAGFDSYFELMCDYDASDGTLIFVDRFYTPSEVIVEVQREVFSCLDTRRYDLVPSFPRCMGFTLGWLSALSLCQSSEAHTGLLTLQQLAVAVPALLHRRGSARPMACR